MEYIFELPIKVRDYEVDSEGIVNNAIYLHYMEHTRHEFCDMAGFTFREMHSMGVYPVVSRADIEYRQPLRLGDTMISRLALSRKGPLFIFIQDIYKPDGSVVAKGKIFIATLVDGKLTRGEILAEKFSKFLK